MNPVEIIAKKRAGQPLGKEEIIAFVNGATDGSFADYQLGALLMAIAIRGMDERETTDLTMAMAHSGDMLDLSGIDGIKADKHSTGGVGDTTTLILVPLCAALGIKMAKMSGRGLGHTGGTLDKLESIPGLTVALSGEQFIHQVNAIGCAVIGQTGELAPADKALYALRDVTATVSSMPLIVSSILSKKIASGADVVVLDVKAGSGAIMPTLEESIQLAHEMVTIGNRTGRKFSALVTDMDQPLGLYIGNALEVEEAIDVLAGRVEGPLKDVSIELGAHIALNAGRAKDLQSARAMLHDALNSGAGLKKLGDMIQAQGGDRRVVEDQSLLPQAKTCQSFRAGQSGYIKSMNTQRIGNAARALGAGRVHKEDTIDPAVGLIMRVRVGDCVEQGQEICQLRTGASSDVERATQLLEAAFEFSKEKPEAKPLIHAVIGGAEAV